MSRGPNLTEGQIDSLRESWGEDVVPRRAADIAKCSLSAVYDWYARFDGTRKKRGKQAEKSKTIACINAYPDVMHKLRWGRA